MKRGDLWREPLPGPIFAWLWAALFAFVALALIPLAPVSLVITCGIAAVALLPSLRPIRTAAFWALLVTWGLALLPGLSSSAGWQFVLLFDAAALAAIEIARDEGVGVPLNRFFRSRKVQGWAALVFCGLWAIGGVLIVDDNLKKSGLPQEWRWSLVPLILLILAPFRWVGGSSRAGWGGVLFLLGFGYWIANHEDKPSESIFGTTFLVAQILAMAGYAHEGWAKIRPPQPRKSSDLGGPVRVHGGGGVP